MDALGIVAVILSGSVALIIAAVAIIAALYVRGTISVKSKTIDSQMEIIKQQQSVLGSDGGAGFGPTGFAPRSPQMPVGFAPNPTAKSE